MRANFGGSQAWRPGRGATLPSSGLQEGRASWRDRSRPRLSPSFWNFFSFAQELRQPPFSSTIAIYRQSCTSRRSAQAPNNNNNDDDAIRQQFRAGALAWLARWEREWKRAPLWERVSCSSADQWHQRRRQQQQRQQVRSLISRALSCVFVWGSALGVEHKRDTRKRSRLLPRPPAGPGQLASATQAHFARKRSPTSASLKAVQL